MAWERQDNPWFCRCSEAVRFGDTKVRHSHCAYCGNSESKVVEVMTQEGVKTYDHSPMYALLDAQERINALVSAGYKVDVTTGKKCECGAQKVGSKIHSTWCPEAK